MDKSSHIKQMLALMLRPAFCVENGRITAVNEAARQYHIKEGTPIASVICSEMDGYHTFQGGNLALGLKIDGYPMDATVSKIDDADIFLLQTPTQDEELRGMSLVANDVRRTLSDSMLLINQFKATSPELQANVDRSIYQLLRMVNNVSDTYRLSIESNASMQMRNICSIVNEIVEKTQAQLQQLGRTLVYHPAPQDILSVADERLLTRAIYNLLSNAIKYSPEGSPITVSVKENAGQMHLSISNDIMAEKPVQIGALFGRYQRTPEITDADAGVGLGITLARKVAIAHGGSVLIEHNDSTMTATLTIRLRTEATLRLRSMITDYDGGFDNSLIELADVLPPEAFLDN